jgi:drug/metabolite transporter superfamily protein YnfA
MIAGVATLGLMNYSFFSSPNNQTFGTWLFANGIVIVLTALIWKLKHPLVRRIFYSWMGIAIVTVTALMVLLTI